MSSVVGLLIALAVLRIGRRGRGLGRLLRFLEHVRLLPGSDAAPYIARTQCLVVRRLGILVPLRVACLEESAATMVALALRGHRVVWCHGIAADPVEFHAWLTTPAGDTIAEPASTERFRALVTVPRTNTDLEPGEDRT
ncbi:MULTISPECIES: lasso peptide biosynthesis B2 protein [unclassified Nocardiopsis]|uniref:lasso peptide biosynthesis B2 protein n=1 Tax=Nocardiopsis TaxID=2013 RepID=UPI00387B5DF5